jgi:hypothetical protein
MVSNHQQLTKLGYLWRHEGPRISPKVDWDSHCFRTKKGVLQDHEVNGGWPWRFHVFWRGMDFQGYRSVKYPAEAIFFLQHGWRIKSYMFSIWH